MKKLKILCFFLGATLIILIGILAVLIAERNDDSMNIFNTYEKSQYKEYFLNENHLKFIGRSAIMNGEVVLSDSGSGIEFLCKSDYTEITLKPESDYVSPNHYPRIAIYSDGVLVVDECISEEKSFRINATYEGTVITVIKLSEAMHSSVKISKVGVFGIDDIEPTQDKSLRIEFIGDSITCGYGIDAAIGEGFSTTTENFSKTYAYLTAKNLNADYSAVCYSGYGVLTGYTENGVINDKIVMNEYEKACQLTGQIDPLWDFSKERNDLVVINLGTNDASYCSGNSYRRQQFVKAYTEMLSQVREKNPDAYILCILGDMNNSLYSSIETAVSSYSESTWDRRVEAFSNEFRMGENDIVTDGHPGALSNLHASEVLTEKINQLISFGYIER